MSSLPRFASLKEALMPETMTSSQPPRQRTVREDHRRNHERLLSAALQLFDAHGLSVPLKVIGDHAGISQASVFRHFSNREQLIVELYDEASVDISNRVLTTMRRTENDSVEHRLDATFATVVATVTEHPSYGELAEQGAILYPDRATDPVLVAHLARLIAASQKAGLLAADVTAFDIVIAPMLVAGMLTRSPGAAVQVPRIMTVLRRGLTPQAATAAPTA